MNLGRAVSPNAQPAWHHGLKTLWRAEAFSCVTSLLPWKYISVSHGLEVKAEHLRTQSSKSHSTECWLASQGLDRGFAFTASLSFSFFLFSHLHNTFYFNELLAEMIHFKAKTTHFSLRGSINIS